MCTRAHRLLSVSSNSRRSLFSFSSNFERNIFSLSPIFLSLAIRLPLPRLSSFSSNNLQSPIPRRKKSDIMEPLSQDIEDLHLAACNAKQELYVDPATGYSVFTAYSHTKRGTCCGSMCRHCPYEWESVPAIKVERYAARQRRLKEKREKKQKEDMQQQHGVTLKTGRSLGNENVKNASIPLTSGVKAK